MSLTDPLKPGRPSIEREIPDIVKATTEIIESLGVAADKTRAQSGVTYPGVSTGQVREELLQRFPKLKEKHPHLANTTIRHLMNPPHRNTISSYAYKGLVPARPCTVTNNLHINTPEVC